jgi:DNA polymerase I-like protein with 3'-5' exonuclease and polymerase domains
VDTNGSAWRHYDYRYGTGCFTPRLQETKFAKQFGAQRKRIRTMFPHSSEEEIDRINDSYYLTFPGVKHYHDYCYRSAQERAYTENLCGVRYYGTSGHKLINILIQGSSASYLKLKIKELYDYSTTHGIKSRYQMNIHDENSWEQYEGEEEIFFEYKRIMEEWPGLPVPIVAEMEVTTTNWAEKKGVTNLAELHACLGGGPLRE